MIASLEEGEHKRITEAMLVILSALDVGANVRRLVKCTHLEESFIEEINRRMRQNHLWIDEYVDDREWCDPRVKEGFGIFMHAQVGLGMLIRERHPAGC